MLDLSIGELDSLVHKAYRGAGFSWGLAQEAGASAAWLAMHGLPSGQMFAQLVPVIDGVASATLTPAMRNAEQWRGSHAHLCPVITGAALSDFQLNELGAESLLVVRQVLQPAILLPFICKLGADIEVRVAGAEYLCSRHGVQQAAQGSQSGLQAHDVTLAPSTRQAAPQPLQQRASIDKSSFEVLQQYAHRTYVPATESSRLAGAGAGLLDND
ncbi:MAG: DUF3726 domain-containing protein [Pseudomonadota bacterium]